MDEPKKALIVDDENGIRRILRIFFELENIEVYEADNEQDVFTIIENNRPDIIILDVVLIGITGFDICKKIKSDPTIKDILVVLFTALNKDSDIAQGENAGADMYFIKPMNPKDVVEKAIELMEKNNS